MSWLKISDTVAISDKGNTYTKLSKDFGMTSTGKTVHKVGSLVMTNFDDFDD